MAMFKKLKIDEAAELQSFVAGGNFEFKWLSPKVVSHTTINKQKDIKWLASKSNQREFAFL